MDNGGPMGMISREELEAAVQAGDIDTVLTVFPDMYGRLMGKRHTGRFFLEHVASGGMHVCDYLLACDIEMDPVPGYALASWAEGYGDFACLPDFPTLRRAAWLPATALVLCDLGHLDGSGPVEQAPRRVLKRQLARARGIGFSVMGGSEIELYLFDESYGSARAKHYHDLRPAGAYIEDYHIFQGTKEEGFMHALRRALDDSGVPVESSKGEWGPGQQELNLDYCEALEQADRNAIYKHAAKEIAYAQGRAVTFMAKWDEKLAGSSMHLHVSLWDTAGQCNQFAGDTTTKGVVGSDTFRWFLGGYLHCAQELTAFWAPYVSSYIRFQAGSFAPTSIAWSIDNRTAGFRVVGAGQSLRIECRVPGADANPYLAYAAAMAAGLYGIEHQIEPPKAFHGDVYAAAELPRVPATLHEATGALAAGTVAREAFGADVVEHYLHFLRTEQRKFDQVVTCWERERFFERI